MQVALNTEYNYSACVFRRKKKPYNPYKKESLAAGLFTITAVHNGRTLSANRSDLL